MPNAPHHATSSPSGLLSAVRKDAPHSIRNLLLFNLLLLQWQGHHFLEGMDVREAVWVRQFLRLDNRNLGHLPEYRVGLRAAAQTAMHQRNIKLNHTFAVESLAV